MRRARACRPRPTAPPWSATWTAAPRCSTTATACAPRPSSAASSAPSTIPASCPPTCARCSARGSGPFRWVALSGDPSDIAATDRAVLEEFPGDESLARWIRMAGERIAFQGLPARICWLGYGERAAARAALQRDGGERRAEGADRDRPRPPRLRLGRLALPRDRGDARRLGRDRRLAAPERAGQHGGRRHLGEHPPRRRRGHRPLDPRRHGLRGRRHGRSRPRSSTACSPPTPAWA